jgi:hypothetical protein
MTKRTIIRLFIVALICLLTSPFVIGLLALVTSQGVGSVEEARRLRGIVEAIPTPEAGDGCHPEYASKRLESGDWVLGISRNSHSRMSSFRGGGTVVLKDSRGAIRCFFGHVCGPAGHRSFFNDVKTLDDYYQSLQEAGFVEQAMP